MRTDLLLLLLPILGDDFKLLFIDFCLEMVGKIKERFFVKNYIEDRQSK